MPTTNQRPVFPFNQSEDTIQAKEPLNLLVTLNAAYIPPLTVMLSSLLHTNSERQIDLYLLHSSLTEKDLEQIRLVLIRQPMHAAAHTCGPFFAKRRPYYRPLSAGNVLSYFCGQVPAFSFKPGALSRP